jgi:hypothetical protein
MSVLLMCGRERTAACGVHSEPRALRQRLQPDPRRFAIMGAAMTVHRILGCGFLESIYRDALAI